MPGCALKGCSLLKEYIEASLQSEIIISTKRLTKAYGKLVAVNDLHVQVMRGDVFGFLGPNGAGKSTTIRMLLGLVRPTAGRALIFGMDTAYQMPTILRHVGAMIEMPVFYPYLTGIDNLRVVAVASGMVAGRANQRRIEEVLELVELKNQARMAYRKYSLGMKQRLGIASALLIDPELLLLDEPTNGLDPAGMYEIRRLIQRLAALGKTIFLSSHLLHEVQQVCNRVAILQKGNLIKQGNVRELLRSKEQIQVRLGNADELERARGVLEQARERGANWIGLLAVEKDHHGQEMLCVDAPQTCSAEINRLLAQAGLFATELHPYEGSLEDVYLQLTTPDIVAGERLGMAALAGGTELVEPSEHQAEERIAGVSGQEKGDQV